MTRRNREELKNYFKTDAIPTEDQFADLIDSALIQEEDGLFAGNGSLGIGTQNPGAKLEVNQNSSSSAIKVSANDKSNLKNAAIMVYQKGVAEGLRIQQEGNGTALKIEAKDDQNNQWAALYVEQDGKAPAIEAKGAVKAARFEGALDAGHITGTLSVEHIPDLDATKITSGTLKVARIPNLSASKIASGKLKPERIPTLPMDKIDGLADALAAKADKNGSSNEDFSAKSLTVSGNASMSGPLSFGAKKQQTLNLYKDNFGIGVQSGTVYFRTYKNFAWYKGGSHDDGELKPGDGGEAQMVIKNGNVGIGTDNPSAKLEVNGVVKAASFEGALDAAKITTGTLKPARIPTLSASKIASGTLKPARIPNLSMDKIDGLADALAGKADKNGSSNEDFSAKTLAVTGNASMGGNVGIGQDAANARLSIRQDGDSAGLHITHGGYKAALYIDATAETGDPEKGNMFSDRAAIYVQQEGNAPGMRINQNGVGSGLRIYANNRDNTKFPALYVVQEGEAPAIAAYGAVKAMKLILGNTEITESDLKKLKRLASSQ